MEIKLSFVIIIIYPVFSFSQNYKIIEDKNNVYYSLNLNDGIDLSVSYPDGRWIIYDSVDTTQVRYHFLLQDNMVHGFFARYENTVEEWGSYYKDSLWTFLSNPNNPTFKAGTWQAIYGGGIVGSDNYPYYYDTNGVFRETWFYINGTIARDVYYKENFGIINLSYYDFDGKLTQKTFNSEQQSITTIYKNDSITYISISQNGINTCVDLSPRYRDITMSVYIENLSKKKDVINLDIDNESNSFLSYIRKENIFIEQDSDDVWTIRYKTKRGKWKQKRIQTE